MPIVHGKKCPLIIIMSSFYVDRENLDNFGTFLQTVKGQLISEQIHAVLDFQKLQQNIARISALAS